MSTGEMRPPRETENLGLPVPGDAGAADQVQVTGDLADAVDALAPGMIGYPGDLRCTASNKIPGGWLRCDGQAIIRGQYPDLFDAIGTQFGAGDGTTTFNLPDLRGRVPLGAGPSDPLGGAGGARRVTLTPAEMPTHAHSVYDPTHAHGVADPGHAHSVSDPGHAHAGYDRTDVNQGNTGNWKPVTGWGGSSGGTYVSGTGIGIYGAGTGIGIYGAATGISLYTAGNGADHENLPPYQAVNWLIKT